MVVSRYHHHPNRASRIEHSYPLDLLDCLDMADKLEAGMKPQPRRVDPSEVAEPGAK